MSLSDVHKQHYSIKWEVWSSMGLKGIVLPNHTQKTTNSHQVVLTKIVLLLQVHLKRLGGGGTNIFAPVNLAINQTLPSGFKWKLNSCKKNMNYVHPASNRKCIFS